MSAHLDPNNIHLDTFVTDRLNQYDDYGYTTDATPIAISGKKNRYAAVAEELAQKIIASHAIKVVGKTAFLYHADLGCYQPIPHLQKWLYQTLDADQREKLRTRDLDEVAARLLFSKQLQAAEDDFNSALLKVNLIDGAWDASDRTVSNHSPSALFTYCIDACYRQCSKDIMPTHDTFDTFCKTSLEDNPQKKKLLLEIIGAIMSDYPAKSAFFLLGESNSGKSVILAFLSRLLGPEMLSSVPLHQLSSRFNLAEIWGKKANISGEIKGKKLPDITVFKSVTGSDLMQAERKGKDPFVFRPRAKLIFAGNVLPANSEMDNTDAFANRLVPLVFNVSIAKENQNPNLLEDLWMERDAIVTDALNAFADWVKRGCIWTLPADSVRTINRFRRVLRSDRLFIEECCVLTKDCNSESAKLIREHNIDLYEAYKIWCKENAFDVVSNRQFFDTVDTIDGIVKIRFRNKLKQYRHGRAGIMLKASLPDIWSKISESLAAQGIQQDHKNL